jgi:hypothetical protein
MERDSISGRKGRISSLILRVAQGIESMNHDYSSETPCLSELIGYDTSVPVE